MFTFVLAGAASLALTAASTAGPIPTKAPACQTGESASLTAAQLRLLVEAARKRLPDFAVRYTLKTGDVALGGDWEYALSEPGLPETSVRLTARTPAPAEARGGDGQPPDPDVVSWGFDASTARAYVHDEVGQSLQLSRTGSRVGLGGVSSEYEQCTGIAPLHCAAFGDEARVDLLRLLAAAGTIVRPGESECGGHSCIVVEAPLGGATLAEEGGPLDSRLRIWVAPDLGYAQVASETILGGKLRHRRSASEFHEVAVGATWLPLMAVVESFTGESSQRVEARVLRTSDGKPQLDLGASVVVTRGPGVGTEVRDLDTGEVRVSTAGWDQQAQRILAAHAPGGGAPAVERHSGWMLAGLPLMAAGVGFGLSRARREPGHRRTPE